MSKLEERRKQYGIPPAPCLPQGKKVVVWRLPLQEKTEGGIIIPGAHANPDPMGVLIAAGLAARDVMRDALIEIGDIVMLPRFTTNSPEVERKRGEAGKHVELLNIEDLVGSVDGMERLEKEFVVEFFETDEGDWEHRYGRRSTHAHVFDGVDESCACGEPLSRNSGMIDRKRRAS